MKPVIFVRSVHTATLFADGEEDELLKPGVEDVGAYTAPLYGLHDSLNTLMHLVADNEDSHIPTANRVARIFSGGDAPEAAYSSNEEELEEIDFNDMSRLKDEVEAIASQVHATSNTTEIATMKVEHTFTRFYTDTAPAILPAHSQYRGPPPTVPETMLRDVDDDEEIIVYDAPMPKVAEQTSASAKVASDVRIVVADETGTARPDLPERPSEAILPVFDDSNARAEEALKPPVTNQQVPPLPIHANTIPVQTNIFAPESIEVSKTPLATSVHTAKTGASTTTDLQVSMEIGMFSPQQADILPLLAAESSALGESVPATSTPPEILEELAPLSNDPASESTLPFSLPPVPTPSKQPRRPIVITAGFRAKAKVQANRARRKTAQRRAAFGSFGALAAEAALHDEERDDPRREERRRGDSDIDWGDSEGENPVPTSSKAKGKKKATDDIDELSSGLGEMDLDPDLAIDGEAMVRFAKGVGAGWMTMDDVADEALLRREDAEQEDRGSSGNEDVDEEIEMVVEMKEREFAGESDEDDSDEDDEATPRSGFKARLERLRENARGKKPLSAFKVADMEDDSDSGDGLTRADQDADFFAELQV